MVATAVAVLLLTCASAAAVGDANVTASCSEETEASPGFRSFMPDCRAYEMVTPPYEAGQLVRGVFMEPPQLSKEGTHIIGLDLAGFADTENLEQVGLEFGAVYEFSRTPTGWSAESLEPPASQYPRRIFVGASADLSKTLWDLYVAPEGDEELGVDPNNTMLAIREGAGAEKGRFTLVGPVTAPGHEPAVFQSYGIVGASADMSHILLAVTADNKQLWPGDSTEEGAESLYEYQGTGDREPVLVGVKNEGSLKGAPYVNDGVQLVSRCGTRLGSAESVTTRNAVSESGEVVYFTALACGETPRVNELYSRIDGSRTAAISEPSKTDCTACDTTRAAQEAAPEGAVFQGASEDGAKVFFTTKQELLPGAAGNSLYEYDSEAPEGERVVLVAGEVTGVAAISEDGARVYFESTAELTGAPNGNGEKAETGSENLYAYDTDSNDSKIAFVAQEPSDPASRTTPLDVTGDGRFAVFSSARKLRGTDDSSTVPQLFEYDAETGKVARVSVGQKSPSGYECESTKTVEEGFACDGNITSETEMPLLVSGISGKFSSPPTGAMSHVSVSEGGAVFFVSRDRLTPDAAAGGENIYEYRSGDVYLISPGDEAVPIELSRGKTRLLGSDESGTDVFFTSTDTLVPQDTDTQSNWYDAREDGGFAAPLPQFSCVATNCQGAPTTAPALPGPGGSETAVAGGNRVVPSTAPTAKRKPRSRAQELATALRACAKKKPGRKRTACYAQARRRYGPPRKDPGRRG